MSVGLHWFPMFCEKWLSSEAIGQMEPAQEGAYIRLLCQAWGDGSALPSLPDNDAALAKLSRLGRRWAKLGPLIRQQFVAADGRLTNAVQTGVWTEQQAKHTKASERAAHAANARHKHAPGMPQADGKQSLSIAQGGSKRAN